MKKTIASKLHKVRVSPLFTAVLGYLVGERWTDPVVTGLTVTSDGCVLLATSADPFFNTFLGSQSDLERNIHGVAKVAGLTTKQTRYLLEQL